MKNKFAIGILAAGLLSLGALTGCGKKNPQPVEVDFSFTISLSNGSKTLNVGEQALIEIVEEGSSEGITREYTYSSSDASIASVNALGTVTAIAKGSVRIAVKEKVSDKSQVLQLTIIDAQPADGGYNYASLAGSEAIETRTEILGQLEKYAMDNHLTGITLFENGGYVKYNSRVTLPTTNYITGYGFGLLSEGSIDNDNIAEDNAAYKRYLHAATSSDPKIINARNDTGSQVSDLEGYITSSFWGTKLNSTKDQYVWYPVLAKDTVTYDGAQMQFSRPIPVVREVTAPNTVQETEIKPNDTVATNPKVNPLGLYKTWRIYVKTTGVEYRYNGTSWGTDAPNFDHRTVALEDYEFAYRMLLTGNHNLKRGPEMAGDQTYGIVGAQRYNTNTKATTITDEDAKTIWNNMKADFAKGNDGLGIQTGHDDVNGDYIQLTILNAIDKFTAMYTFSSNLLSPMPEEFIKTIGGSAANPIREGAQRYGSFNNNDAAGAHKDKILDFTLSVGPYMLEAWDKNQSIVFKKNSTWNEPGRYNIEGVKLIVIDASTDSDAIYKQFNANKLDSCGIPTKHISEEVGKTGVYKTKGDSTFKLNVNSCTKEYWNELFGPTGKINKNSSWDVKPWMSNDNFLTGLFFSIDRKTFAGNRGVQPSINYFSDAYLNDPENGKSYNDTEAHKNAVAAYETHDSQGNSTYGYSKDKAILAFRAAVKELVASGDIIKGTKDNPYPITIHIKWMYQTDIKEYGEEIKGYFESAFNDPKVSDGTVKLTVTQDAVTNWQDVYNEYLMKGQFDLGFGAISGNTYNPLNFLEVLKSDNSSGFTLNWGTDTSKVTKAKPLIYQDKMWSFDALWAVADHGGVVNNGENVKPVKKAFLNYAAIGDNFYQGGTFWVPTQFVDINDGSVKFEVNRVSLYVIGSGNIDLPFEMDEGDPKIILTAAKADEINQEIRRVRHMDDKDNYPSLFNEYPFVTDNYGKYWTIEVYYTLSIKDPKTGEWGTPSQNYVTAAKNEAAWVD